MKQECYVFDFSLDRALKEIADWIKQDETATASLIQTVSAKADKSYVDEKYAQITSIDEGSIDTLF